MSGIIGVSPNMKSGIVGGFPYGVPVLLSEQDASTSASVEFINGTGGAVLDTTYKYYKIVFQGVANNGAYDLYAQCGISDGGGGSTWLTSGYRTSSLKIRGSGGTTTLTSNIWYADRFWSSEENLTGTGGYLQGEVLIGRMTEADPSTFITTSTVPDGYAGFIMSGSMTEDNTVYDRIRFVPSGGTIYKGNFRLYGTK